MMKRFTPVPWAHNTNIYEVNLRQYTPAGTIKAFVPHMKRLQAMGVKTLWFMPLTPISEKNKKGTLGSYYACSDYISMNAEFGSIEDFIILVQEAHKMGMKVILDWVANHTGWDHVWTTKHPEFYERDITTGDFKAASGMDDIIELDFLNPILRKAMIEAMSFWVRTCDIDGFRCDLAFWVELDFWKEARPALDAIKPLFWLGEFDELDTPEYGEVFDASYTWTWMHKTEDFYKGKISIHDLFTVLKKYDDIGDDTIRAWFTSNHDENSWNGTENEKYGEMAAALAVFSATWNGIPLLYSGQELPNRKRLQFFEKDIIQWSGEYQLEDFYYRLLCLQANHPALRGGDSSVKTFLIKSNPADKLLFFLRKNEHNEVLTVLNLSADTMNIELLDSRITGVFTEIFTDLAYDFSMSRHLTLNAWGYQVFQK